MKYYEDPEYQLMVERAEEIQEIARKNPPTTGAYLRHLGQSSVCVDEHGRFFLNDRETRIYLPSQEDLQKMLEDKGTQDWLLSTLESWTDETYRSHWKPWHFFRSMTKLWLAFVMHELYQKKWNPENKKWEVENANH